MNGAAYVEVIEHLDKLKCEASYRTKIGRFYYSAYLQLKAVCVDKGYEPVHNGTDHELVRAFIRDTLKNQQVAKHLKALREERNRADYGTNLSITPRNVAAAANLYGLIERQLPKMSMKPTIR